MLCSGGAAADFRGLREFCRGRLEQARSNCAHVPAVIHGDVEAVEEEAAEETDGRQGGRTRG